MRHDFNLAAAPVLIVPFVWIGDFVRCHSVVKLLRAHAPDRPVDIDLVAQEAEGQIWSSRQHSVIHVDKSLLFVEDLNSLNGTWVNGARLHPGQKRPLKATDVIQIGTVQLKLVIG